MYEGRYIPGQRLAEPDLMAYYDASRSTVREALKQLSADGVVVHTAFRGSHIRSLTRSEAADLFSITEVLMGLTARQAAERLESEEDRDKLLDLFHAIENYQDEEGRYAFLRLRNRFFLHLVAISKNNEILRILPSLQVHLIRNRLSVPKQERIEGYRRITQAVLSGDATTAEEVTRSYVHKTARCILPHFSA
jgi:DNA-binding GntR family transcriptional regulator